MPKRTIYIQNAADISVAQKSLVVSQGQQIAKVPLEDIGILILESHRARITSAALSAMVAASISVVTCGPDHMPNGLALPLGAHSRYAAIVESQLAMGKPLRKQLWRRIVIQKILNQASVLDLLGKDSSDLRRYASNVLSDDNSGREAVAAAVYFKRAIPEGTRREGRFAAALDYGYAIIRAAIGRAAASGGWLLSHGLHHSNALNAFNLVNDIIEPFRPLVDLLVFTNSFSQELTSDDKRQLASVLEYQMAFDDRKLGLQAAIDEVFDTLKTSVVQKNANLLHLPRIIGLDRIGFE